MKDKFLVKTIDKETIRIEGEKVKAKPKSKAPTWFSEFSEKLDNRLEKIESNQRKMMNTPTMKKELEG